jgi:hypothetical protein
VLTTHWGLLRFNPPQQAPMTKSETLLLHEVQPRLRAAIPKAVPIVGADDIDELVQDGVAIAIALHRRAKKAGKKVTGSNLAHYALLHLRSGRRSTGYRKNDVHAPACQLAGRSRLRSLDEPLSDGEHDDGPLSLHDCLAAPVDDPATIAARSLDWKTVINSLDRTARAILVALAECRELTLLVRPLKRSRSALHYDKVRLGRVIQDHLGQDILRQVQTKSAWTNTMDAAREKLACRAERRAT